MPTLAELGVTRKESMEAQAAAERAKGTRGAGRPKLGSNQRELPKNTPTLAELGVTLKESREHGSVPTAVLLPYICRTFVLPTHAGR